MSAVDAAVLEIDQQLAALAPTHEGLRDYERLNVQSATRDIVRKVLSTYDNRVQQLTNARVTLVALQTAGYPTLAVPEITAAIYQDFAEQQLTITAALALFQKPAHATALGLASTPPEAK